MQACGSCLPSLPRPSTVGRMYFEATWREGEVIGISRIVLSGLRNPWPDATTLDEHIAGAVREAKETSRLALAEVEQFASQWRGVARV